MRHRVVVAVVPGSVDPGGVIVHTAAPQLHIKEGFSDNKEKKMCVQMWNSRFSSEENKLLVIYLLIYISRFHQLHAQNTGGLERAHEWPTLKTSDTSIQAHRRYAFPYKKIVS